MTIGSILKIIIFYKFKSPRVLKRLSIVGKMAKPPKNKELFLSCFCVAENLRGKGIGELIIREHLKFAKENNYLIYGLDVSENNPMAKKLYERLGLKTVIYKISPTKKIYNSFKMEIEL